MALGGEGDREGWRAEAFRIVSACILIAIAAFHGRPATAGIRAGLAVRPARPVTVTTVEHPIARGESFARILGRYGIPSDEIQKWYRAALSILDLRRIHAGRTLSLSFDDEKRLGSFRYDLDEGERLVVRRRAEQLTAKREQAPAIVSVVAKRGVVAANFYESAQSVGIPEKVISRMIDVLSGRIDFSSRLRAGDRFRVLYEERRSNEGELLAPGNLLAADFVGQQQSAAAFRYEDELGAGIYLDAAGQPLEARFLTYPLEFTRITSSSSKSRFHPILKQRRAHRGVDFAAPSGTPVRAVGVGKVKWSGWKGGLGRHVEIDHGNGLVTAYSHLRAIDREIRPNRPIARGQIVGWVGQSGLATGPHLHFAMFEHGRYRNPLTARPEPQPVRVDAEKFGRIRADMVSRLGGLRTGIAKIGTDQASIGLFSPAEPRNFSPIES